MSLLARLAAAAPVPVFVLVGDGGRARARRLQLDRRVERVETPRRASVLLTVGAISPMLNEEARRTHDQMPKPCGVVAWADEAEGAAPLPARTVVPPTHDPVPAIVALHRALVLGARVSDEPLGPRDNPVKWRGEGPHGQGGEGMMGGRPYGRPMAELADDMRDGLKLDGLCVPLGPFLPFMPPGLRLDVTLQGDVVQAVGVHVIGAGEPELPDVFVRAREHDVALAELERARAVALLESTADLLTLHGLDAWTRRTLQLARDVGTSTTAASVLRLHDRLRRTGALRLATHGVGRIEADAASGLGPVARASGCRQDARCHDPAYAELGFAPIVGRGGDAEARWQQRLQEAAQALELAARAGDRPRRPHPSLELPYGGAGCDRSAWPGRLAEVGKGQPLDAFVTTVVSLDLEVAERAA